MCGERCFEMAVGGIESPSPRLTVRRSTARPQLPIPRENTAMFDMSHVNIV